MENAKCAIWGTELTEKDTGSVEGSVFCISPRAGGLYEYGWRLGATIGQLDAHDKAKLTTWLVDQRWNGVRSPFISIEIIEQVKKSALCSTSDRIERLLTYFSKEKARPGYSLDVCYPEIDRMMACSESLDQNDFYSLIKLMGEMNFIDDVRMLTSQAFTRIEDLERTNRNSKQAFVAMWFHPSLEAAYDEAIEPAILDAGYEPRIIRKIEHNNKIDDEIIAEIRCSKFVIADFTCGLSSDGTEPFPRGGVYYEAGFAQGLGLPVIWTCRKDIIDGNFVHFDTRQYNHITWETPAELKKKLYDRIRATIT